MTDIQVRDFDEEVVQELARRAASTGMSLSAYVAGELAKLVARPTNEQVVDRLRQLDRSRNPGRGDIFDALEASGIPTADM